MFQELKSAIDARSCHEYRDFGGRDARGDTARGEKGVGGVGVLVVNFLQNNMLGARSVKSQESRVKTQDS
jgi:hypothetical protein